MCAVASRAERIDRIVSAALSNFYDIARLYRVRRNIHFAAIHRKVTVAYELAALSTAGGEAHAIDQVVEPPFEHGQHQLAGNTFLIHGLLIKVPELPFENAIVAPRFLLLAQLQTVADELGLLVLAVLARSEVALLDGAFFGVAALAFQEQLHALAPAKPAHRAAITCQIKSPLLTLAASSADGSRYEGWA